MNNIVDGFVFLFDGKFYNLQPQSHNGDIVKEVEPGDILYCFYDLDEAESAREDCINRVEEWYELDIEPDEINEYLEDMELVSVSSVMDLIASLSLVVEAAYLC